MASAPTSADWISCCRSNRGDGGTIEALFNLDDDELAVISKGHCNNVGAFRATIANSGGGNFLLIPGPKGTVQLLHQGFVSTTTLGGAAILGFVQGKFSSSPFKTIVRPADAVKPTDLGRAMTRGQAAPAACPTAKPIFSVSNAEEFAALPGEVDTLDGMPNHIFVHPRIFTRTDGIRATRSKDLAWEIIKQLTEELNNATTDSERADVAEEQDNVEVLLAFLWASERGLLSPVTLGDMEESPHLNHQCELILNKIRTPVNSQAGTSLNSASGLAVATHSLVISVQNAENNRIQERAEDKCQVTHAQPLSQTASSVHQIMHHRHAHRGEDAALHRVLPSGEDTDSSYKPDPTSVPKVERGFLRGRLVPVPSWRVRLPGGTPRGARWICRIHVLPEIAALQGNLHRVGNQRKRPNQGVPGNGRRRGNP